MWEVKKIQDFCPQDIWNPAILRQQGVETIWLLNANLFFDEPHLLTEFT